MPSSLLTTMKNAKMTPAACAAPRVTNQRVGQQHEGADLQQGRREQQPEVEHRVEQTEGVGDCEGHHDPHRQHRRQGEQNGDGGRRQPPAQHAAAERRGGGVGDLAIAGAVVTACHGAHEPGHHEHDDQVVELDQQRADEVRTGVERTVRVKDDMNERAADAHGGENEERERRCPAAEREGDVPDRFAPRGPQPRRPSGRAERRDAGSPRIRVPPVRGAARTPRRRCAFQRQPLALHPAQHDDQQEQSGARPEQAVGPERRRHLQDAHGLLARRPEVGLLLHLRERGRVEERRDRGVRVGPAHHHHGDHPDQHHRGGARERPAHAPRTDGGAQEQGARPHGRRQGQDQQRLADREVRLRSDRVGREQAEGAEGRDQQEPDPRGQRQHAGQGHGTDVAAGEERAKRDWGREHHLVQAGRTVAHDYLCEEPGPDEEEPDCLPGDHQVDEVRAVARHVGRAEVAQVVRVQQHEHQVGDHPGERDRDERPPAAGAELVPSLGRGEAQGAHATASSSRTPALAMAAW